MTLDIAWERLKAGGNNAIRGMKMKAVLKTVIVKRRGGASGEGETDVEANRLVIALKHCVKLILNFGAELVAAHAPSIPS